ncbi:aspartate/glutamate racemase family protein, partial [Mycobacterium tuberculosis]|uniref:aspartate/glutamate racemase family protein n=1 Tax=Mycobacterium tuberculosis TaxID=1773 RepID=UPI001AEB3690|nr:aspartate/glutamate racemase family protein [Mycobacterium tuberculosis]
IGGMSTASSISYYQKINEQINQLLGANHGARLVIYNLDFEEIAQLQKQGNWQKAGEILADAAKRLVLAGVDGIFLATNTMHKVAE